MFDIPINEENPLTPELKAALRFHLDRSQPVGVIVRSGDLRGELFAVEITFFLRTEGYQAEWSALTSERPFLLGVKITALNEVWVGSGERA